MKRGISLYSFQEEFFRGELDLEGCIREAVKMGGKGIELVSEQMFFRFPYTTDADYEKWKGYMDKYGAVSFAHDMNYDTKRFPGRLLTLQEMADWAKLNFTHAARMNVQGVRLNQVTPPEIWPVILEMAEKYGLTAGVEVHPPFHFGHPRIQQHLEAMDKLGSTRLGFIVDTGIFEKRFSRIKLNSYLRKGANPKLAAYIRDVYDAGEAGEGLMEKVESMGGKSQDLILARDVSRMVYIDPRTILPHMSRILWIHAKFYEMTEAGEEYSIPFDEIISVLREGGFDGCICSEYEGNRYIQDLGPVDSLTQVRRQQQMLARLLGEEKDDV